MNRNKPGWSRFATPLDRRAFMKTDYRTQFPYNVHQPRAHPPTQLPAGRPVPPARPQQPPAPQGPSCEMRRITVDFDTWFPDRKPGDFMIQDSTVSKERPYCIPQGDEPTVTIKYFSAVMPTGDFCSLPIRPVPATGHPVNAGHSWAWDGNLDKPTLTPSVHLVGKWHGYVTAGRMISC